MQPGERRLVMSAELWDRSDRPDRFVLIVTDHETQQREEIAIPPQYAAQIPHYLKMLR